MCHSATFIVEHRQAAVRHVQSFSAAVCTRRSAFAALHRQPPSDLHCLAFLAQLFKTHADPFRHMQDRQLKYGFTVIVPEQMLTVPSLWQITRLFQTTHNLTAGHLQNFVQHGVWNTCSYWCALQNKHYPQHSLVISERLQGGHTVWAHVCYGASCARHTS